MKPPTMSHNPSLVCAHCEEGRFPREIKSIVCLEPEASCPARDLTYETKVQKKLRVGFVSTGGAFEHAAAQDEDKVMVSRM